MEQITVSAKMQNLKKCNIMFSKDKTMYICGCQVGMLNIHFIAAGIRAEESTKSTENLFDRQLNIQADAPIA